MRPIIKKLERERERKKLESNGDFQMQETIFQRNLKCLSGSLVSSMNTFDVLFCRLDESDEPSSRAVVKTPSLLKPFFTPAVGGIESLRYCFLSEQLVELLSVSSKESAPLICLF